MGRRKQNPKQTMVNWLGLSLVKIGYTSLAARLNCLMVALRQDHATIERQWLRCVQAWRSHPDFDWYHSGQNQMRLTIPATDENTVLLGVFAHAPGQHRRTASYTVGPLQHLLSQIDWAERTLGDFVGIQPLPPEIVLQEDNLSRFCYISFSFRGSGKAYHARLELRRLLPREVHPLISLARTCANMTLGKLRTQHGFQTKKDYFLQEFAREQRPTAWLKLQNVMAPATFYDCATGKVHPYQIEAHVAHQRPIPLLTKLPTHSPPTKLRRVVPPKDEGETAPQLSFLDLEMEPA